MRPPHAEFPGWALLPAAGSFVLTGYAGVRLLAGDTVGVLVWFVGAAVLHDLVLLPLYASADRLLQALPRLRGRASPEASRDAGAVRAAVPWINHVRVPAFVSGVLLLVWFPLILGQVERYGSYTALPAQVFPRRWLLITAGLFAASALLWAVRVVRSRLRARAGVRTGPDAEG